MNNSTIGNLLSYSIQETIEYINSILSSTDHNKSMLFISTSILVFKCKFVFPRLRDELLPEIIVSLFLHLYNKTETDYSDIITTIRKDIWEIFESHKFHAPRDGSFFVDLGEECTDAEDMAYVELIKNKCLDLVPDRLLPIVTFYLDEGKLLVSMLSDVDKFIVMFFIDILGLDMNVDSDYILSIIPTDPKDRAIFMNGLAVSNPLMFIMLMSSGSISNLVRITEIFGGSSIEIPTTDKLVADLEHLSTKTNSTNSSDISEEFLSSFIKESDQDSIKLNISMLEFFNNVLTREFDILDKAGDKLMNSYITPDILSKINYELNKTISMSTKLSSI